MNRENHRSFPPIANMLAWTIPVIVVGLPWMIEIGLELKSLSISSDIIKYMMMVAVVSMGILVMTAIPLLGKAIILETSGVAKFWFIIIEIFILISWLYMFVGHGLSQKLELSLEETLTIETFKQHKWLAINFAAWCLLSEVSMVGLMLIEARKQIRLAQKEEEELNDSLHALRIERNIANDQHDAISRRLDLIKRMISNTPSFSRILTFEWLEKDSGWKSQADIEIGIRQTGIRSDLDDLVDGEIIQRCERAGRIFYAHVGQAAF